MIADILGAAAVYRAGSPEKLKERHLRWAAKMRAHGIPVQLVANPTPHAPSVNHGRWLFDCVCGSCVSPQPGWPEARCFGCGAVYTHVTFPTEQAAIAAALVQRPQLTMRNWNDTETVDDLIAENVERGL